MYFSSEIRVGKLCIGGNNPVSVQSMTTTDTMDTVSTVNQIIDLVNVGCELVRVTTRNIEEANNLRVIKDQLAIRGVDVPLIADVHFNPKVAEVAAQHCEKVRINPGNYYHSDGDSNDEETISIRLLPLLKICAKHATAIRIGVNHGSLSKRILEKYGNTARGMVESLVAFINVCDKFNFNNLILSVKASNVKMMIEANILLVEKMIQMGKIFPIHLGVTEAGNEEEGRIKSAAGIGYMLSQGIGDTIRVSLTEDPVQEIPVAKLLISRFGLRSIIKSTFTENIIIPNFGYTGRGPFVITTGKSNLSDISFEELKEESSINKQDSLAISKYVFTGSSVDELLVEASVAFTSLMYSNSVNGVYISAEMISDNECARILKMILQVLGLRITNAEFIACPTCGRTEINLVDCLTELKHKTSQLVGLKLAVMGCLVNGPGEMVGADYGIVGSGSNKVKLYKGNAIVKTNIPQEQAVDELISIIKENGDWK